MPVMELLRIKCPGCGAQLPPRAPAGTIQCNYCQSEFQANQVKSATTVAGQQMDTKALAKAIALAQQEMAATQQAQAYAHATNYAVTAQKRGMKLAMIIGGFSILITVVAGLIPMLALQDAAETFGTDILAHPASPPSLPVNLKDRVTWDDVGGPIQMLNLDNEPGFVGRTRTVADGDNLYIDAYAANTVERKWRIGPLGTYSEGYRSTYFQVAGNRVVVSDKTGTLYLHDAANGAELKKITLSDRVESMCAPTDAPDTVWVVQVDERSHLLNTQTGEMTEAPRPKACEKQRHPFGRDPKVKLAPKVKGFETKRVYFDGPLAVVTGVKSPGTGYPRALGFDPATKAVRWEEDIATVDRSSVREDSNKAEGLAADRFISIYGSGQDFWHLTALDAKTGARLWDTQLRPIFAVDRVDKITVSKTHVFVSRTSSLEVFDATNGKLLGTIGNETYEK